MNTAILLMSILYLIGIVCGALASLVGGCFVQVSENVMEFLGAQSIQNWACGKDSSKIIYLVETSAVLLIVLMIVVVVFLISLVL